MRNFLLIALLMISIQSVAQKTDSILKIYNYHSTKGIFSHSADSRLDYYDVKFYKLDIAGNATIVAKVVAPQLDTFVVELNDEMIVDSVVRNNTNLSFLHNDNKIIVKLSEVVNENEQFSVTTYYHGTAVGGGVTNSHSSEWEKDVTWTLSESFHAKEWWPTKQVLDDKADSVYVFLTIPADCKAGSIGLLDNITNMPDNKLRYEWKSKYPINYYLISFSVSEYQDYSIYTHPAGTSDSILIQNYIYDSPNCLSTYKNDIDATKDLINLYSDLYGTYPFKDEKYGHCLAEIGGGMEHQTMTTLGNFSFRLVSHELAHQWFGDYVTCATWQDIWINEGFASYTEYLAKENLESQEAADEWIAYANELALREPYGSVYIPFEDANNENRIFNYNLSYKKGASIIHTLRHEINNDNVFFNIMQSFLDEYSDSVASGDDFLNTVNAISGNDYTNYFDQWYYGSGYPIFDVEWSQQNDSLQLTSIQRTTSSKTPLFQVHVDYKINFADSDTIIIPK
jgi:aminopeptidase N